MWRAQCERLFCLLFSFDPLRHFSFLPKYIPYTYIYCSTKRQHITKQTRQTCGAHQFKHRARRVKKQTFRIILSIYFLKRKLFRLFSIKMCVASTARAQTSMQDLSKMGVNFNIYFFHLSVLYLVARFKYKISPM